MSNENMSEVISSLVDGETEISQTDIENIKNNPETAKKWANYHLISDILQDKAPAATPKDFAQGVMHAIAQEPVVLAPKAKASTKSWYRPIAGLAVAATVAMVTIGGLQTVWNNNSIDKPAVLISQTDSQQSTTITVNNGAQLINRGPATAGITTVSTDAARVGGIPVANAGYGRDLSSDLRWKRISPAQVQQNELANKKMADELNKLLMNHVRSVGTMQGMLPYARFAGYDENQ